MIINLLICLALALDENVSFYILKEGLIRPDQDKIIPRSVNDYYPANFGSDHLNPATEEFNLGKVSDPIITNNITIILEKIIEPDPETLNDNTRYIDWYVLKKECDGWHIDGQSMPYTYNTIYFFNQNELYASARVRKNTIYYFNNDIAIWKNGQEVDGKIFNYWEYYENYTPYDSTGRAFLVTEDMYFYAIWYSETTSVEPEETTSVEPEETSEKNTPIVVISVVSSIVVIGGAIVGYSIYRCKKRRIDGTDNEYDIYKMDDMISI